jgi:hypothetical protein
MTLGGLGEAQETLGGLKGLQGAAEEAQKVLKVANLNCYIPNAKKWSYTTNWIAFQLRGSRGGKTKID